MDKFKSIPFETRKAEAQNIAIKYPDRIPVIIDKLPSSRITAIDKHKYLVPIDASIGQMLMIIRKRIKLSAEQSLFIFVNGALPSVASSMGTIYDQYKEEDGFLYIYYTGESTFGYSKL
jgi:GABA(A) receptor-associated protein